MPPSRGIGRVSNRDLYDELYVAADAECAIAETFAHADIWTDALFDHPHGRYALASYDAGDAQFCDLDHAQTLVELELKPSQVVTRDRATTQAWSRTVFERAAFAGVSWWWFYWPEWATVAIWQKRTLRLKSVLELHIDDPYVVSASRTIRRRLA